MRTSLATSGQSLLEHDADAGLRAREAGEEDLVEVRCAECYRSRCENAPQEARYRLIEWLEWMDLQTDNIRSVLQRCLAQHDSRRGLELATLIGWYWITRATNEGIRWIDALLAIGGGDPQADALTHFLRGHLAVLQSDPAAAAPVPSRSSTIEPARDEHEPEHPTRAPGEEGRFWGARPPARTAAEPGMEAVSELAPSTNQPAPPQPSALG